MTASNLQRQKAAARDKRRYVKLHLKGEKATCIVEPHEAADMLADDPDLSGEAVWMTVDEFEALPDFQGW